jgi:hypothetical protein
LKCKLLARFKEDLRCLPVHEDVWRSVLHRGGICVFKLVLGAAGVEGSVFASELLWWQFAPEPLPQDAEDEVALRWAGNLRLEAVRCHVIGLLPANRLEAYVAGILR